MKIAVDGFTLGIAKGTGLTTYARELCGVLTSAGHSIYPVYGLPRVSRKPLLRQASFIQRLCNKGEPKTRDILAWSPAAVGHFFRLLTGLSSPIRKVAGNEHSYALGAVRDMLPLFETAFNAEGVYRAAQFLSYVTHKPLRMRFSADDDPNIDLFHITSPLPLRIKKIPTIVSIHDIIPIVFSHSTKYNISHYYNLVYASIKNADIIFSVSEHTKNDILRLFKINESKIHVTYQSSSLEDRYDPLDDDYVKKIYMIFLIWNTKNIFYIMEI